MSPPLFHVQSEIFHTLFLCWKGLQKAASSAILQETHRKPISCKFTVYSICSKCRKFMYKFWRCFTKTFQLQGALSPRTLTRGSAPWTPLDNPVIGSRSTRSPYVPDLCHHHFLVVGFNISEVDAVRIWCGVKCVWMVASMSTWLSIVHLTKSVHMELHLLMPAMPTTAATKLWETVETVYIPDLRCTRGGRSTWEYHCTSPRSSSPTDISVVRL